MKLQKKQKKKKDEKKLAASDLDVKLHLTLDELKHIRDLFSVTIQPSSNTVSEMLAIVEKREDLEKTLWEKVFELCKSSNLPVEEKAPDFVVGVADLPPLGLFKPEKE